MPYETKEEILALAEINPELDVFLKSVNIPPVDYSNLDDFKKMAEERTTANLAALGTPPPSIKQTDRQYPASDGRKLRARLYQPATTPAEGSPLIVMFHGGGFCIGTPEGEEQTCRNFVQAFGAVCVSAAYGLGPEFPFPYAVKDAWEAVKWAAASAKSFGATPSVGFVVGGTSAGGNITAVIAHLARDEKLSPPLTGQYLSIPALVPSNRVPEKYKHLYLSMAQNVDVPVLPVVAIDMFMRGYQPDDDSPLYNVICDPKGHWNLPPAYFQINGLDPLRDEGLIYEKILREEMGTKTKLDMYPGLPHGFWGFFPMLKASTQFREDMVKGMGWLLGRNTDVSKINTDAEATIV